MNAKQKLNMRNSRKASLLNCGNVESATFRNEKKPRLVNQ